MKKSEQSIPPEEYTLPKGGWLLDAYHLGNERNRRQKKEHYDVYWCPVCTASWQPNWSHVWDRGKKVYMAKVEYLENFRKKYLREKVCRHCK